MLHVMLQALGVWIVIAIIVGVLVGASIRSAENLRKEELLTYMFSLLAAQQSIMADTANTQADGLTPTRIDFLG